MSNYTWDDFAEIFGIDWNRSISLADTTNAYRVTIEYTINLSPSVLKKLSLIEKVRMYKEIHENLKAEYRGEGIYTIEYCKSGEPHIHGYLDINLSPQQWLMEDKLILQMLAKSIYLKLPRSVFKQYGSMKYDYGIRRLKSPAVCLNLKNCISKGWIDYIEKTQV